MNTPIVFLVFNRPETTQLVFETIRQVKPKKLLVVADGPRPHKEGEENLCLKTRNIVKNIDWDCELFTNFSETNLGCKKRVSSGLDWAFSLVEEAIILEDDCRPDLSFFEFCSVLLSHYKSDKRIMSICGENAQFGRFTTQYSYYFSRYFHCWGWATWRRAWELYDVEMKAWPQIEKSEQFSHIFHDTWVENHWRSVFKSVYDGEIDTWDHQWLFACLIQNGLSVIPAKNLISNIGFGGNATHTYDSNSTYANVNTSSLNFPLQHNPFMIPNTEADEFEEQKKFQIPNSLQRLKIKLKKTFGRA